MRCGTHLNLCPLYHSVCMTRTGVLQCKLRRCSIIWQIFSQTDRSFCSNESKGTLRWCRHSLQVGFWLVRICHVVEVFHHELIKMLWYEKRFDCASKSLIRILDLNVLRLEFYISLCKLCRSILGCEALLSWNVPIDVIYDWKHSRCSALRQFPRGLSFFLASVLCGRICPRCYFLRTATREQVSIRGH